jgi:isopenicillin-N epimerase
MRDLFLLDPDVVFLNHGSFGATPRPVFETYQRWQRQLEAQPVRFLGRELPGLLLGARQALARLIQADVDEVVFVPNATFGVNVVSRSLLAHLQPGDEILTTDHEYGACSNAWEFVCARTGAVYVRQPLPLPDELEIGDQAADSIQSMITERFWQGVTERTKVIYLSHITSPTAQRLPVEQICARARAAGILTLIDGAHAPGQIDLDMQAIGADFYTGNCHKWLCAPKGAGFLHVRSAVQHMVQPLVVSWGWGPERGKNSGNDFVDMLEWQGTDDFAAYLSVPAAIDFQAQHDWPQQRQRCNALLRRTLMQISQNNGLPLVYLPAGADAGGFAVDESAVLAHLPPQLGIASLPESFDLAELRTLLYDHHHIEIPLVRWRGRQFVRLSVQVYTSEAECATLVSALG